MSYKILSYPNNPRAWKAVIAGKYVGVNIEYPPFNFGVDNKTPEFLHKNPVGKVPVLETPDGAIFESNAIARYVARIGKSGHIYGNNAYETALVDAWIDFTTGEIDLPASAWLYPILGFVPNNPEATKKAKDDIRKALTILNDYLQTRTFLVNERVSLADIVVATHLLRLYELVLDPGFRKSFHNTNRWFLTCVHQPEFKSVIGEVKLCEKMQVAKEAAHAPAAEGKKEQKPPKEPKEPKKPKEAPKPKQEKQEKPKKEEHDDEEEDEERESAKNKPKNPLDLLPPSPFVLDEWKRTYSNNDTRTVAIPWFWQHFDSNGYSVWFCEYKYNAELQKLFMTSNLVTGFLQRLDKLRKYGFGCVLIFGKEPDPMSISGIFIVRGQEIPPELKVECDDYELYNWTKADLTNAETKKKVEDFLAWDGDFGGRGKPTDGKTFK